MPIPPASYTLEYPYSRTTGKVVGAFLTGVRDGRIVGIRCGDRVICPPLEFDPETGEELSHDFVPVGPGGRVETATWIARPTRKHPFQTPFAFALIKLDGADTAIVHAIKASSPDAVKRGSRVVAQWRDVRKSAISDMYFVPEGEARDAYVPPGEGEVEMTEHLISLDFVEPLSPHRIRYAEALLEGKFIGAKSPANGKVYFPSKGYDAMSRVRMTAVDDVELPYTGTVVSYTVITPVQYYGQKETEVYIRASILLDGADQPLGQQDIRDIPPDEFRSGLRVKAIIRPRTQRSIEGMDNRWGSVGNVIERWEPTGEPDVPFDEYREHVF